MSRGKYRREKAKPEKSENPAVVVIGWTIYLWREFAEQLAVFRQELDELKQKHPEDWQKKAKAKFIARVFRIILEEVPRNPGDPAYRQGKTLGNNYKHWKRAKFDRFRLFFRYSDTKKIILFVWLNDETTRRKAGAKTDVYSVFASMLVAGKPPSSWDQLVAQCKPMKSANKKAPPV